MLAYARMRNKPARQLLVACALANTISVTALALALMSHLLQSVLGLVGAEIVIWLFEAAFLRRFRGTQVGWLEAIFVSLGMNLASLGAGFAVVVLLSG